MTDDLEPISTEFEAASREAWLKLVDKVLKGGSFERQLVSETADGLRIDPLVTRSEAARVTSVQVGRPAAAGHRWDIRQRHAEPDPKLCNGAILEDLEGGVNSLLLQIEAPGQWGLGYGAEPLASALKGVRLDQVPIALDARENTLDAAGSLIEIWREAGIGERQRRGAFNYDPLGVLAKTGTLYYAPDRACEIAAKFASDQQAMPNVTALLADARPYHEAGAGEAQELARWWQRWWPTCVLARRAVFRHVSPSAKSASPWRPMPISLSRSLSSAPHAASWRGLRRPAVSRRQPRR
jgi:methylmalonyl-CoA mutase